MSRLCLDTRVYSELRRGTPEVVEILRRAGWVGMPTVVLGELHAGFLLGGHRDRNELELEAFLAEPAVTVLGIDAETARHYAALVVALRGAGTPVPTNDIWIAACAVRHGATVVTLDGHFQKMEGVSVQAVRRA